MTTEFTPIAGLIGGCLIGLSAVILMWGQGRIAGISGIFSGLLTLNLSPDTTWRATYIFGILTGAILAAFAGAYSPAQLGFIPDALLLAASGVLVGMGTQLGAGCTSGHGICGIARLSPRSITATATFMLVAIAVVYITRHLI